MDDDLQIVDDVIEIQDDDETIDDGCDLEVSDQIDFTQDDSNMTDDTPTDDAYFEPSSNDYSRDGEGYRESRRSNNTSVTSIDEDRRQSSNAGKNETKDDFDDLDYDTDNEECKEGAFTDDAEDYEKEYLNMPILQTVLNDLGSLKQGRRLMAQPLKMEELNHPVVMEIFEKLSSEDIKLQFVRSKDDASEWRGFLLMHFSSCKAAREAAIKLKTIREDLDVKAQNETAYASKIMEQWIKDEKGQKKWTDALIIVKNVPEGTCSEQVEELFPDCEDVLIIKNHDRNKDRSRDAYVMFHNKEHADKESKEYQYSGVDINGVKHKVFKYHVPHEAGLKGLLKLSQRKMIMKYIDKLKEELEKEDSDEGYKALHWCKKRLEASESSLERDDKARRMAGLPAHSYEKLVALGVRSLRANGRKDALIRMGIMDRPHRRSSYHPSGSSGGRQSHNKSGGISSMNRSRNYSNYDNRSFNQNRRSESLLGNPPSLTSMGPLVPPLLALQHNAGMMRMMMAQQQQRTFESPNMRRGDCREPPTKLLRMDEKGMFHNYRPHQSGNSSTNRGRGDKRPMSLLDL